MMNGDRNHQRVENAGASLESVLDKAIGPDSIEADVMRRIREKARLPRANRRTASYVYAAVGIAVAMAAVWFWPQRLHFEAVTGDRLIVIDGEERVLDGKVALTVGSSVSTRQSMLVVRPDRRCVIVLDSDTDAHLSAGKSLSVEKGRFYYRNEDGADSGWMFGTPIGGDPPGGDGV